MHYSGYQNGFGGVDREDNEVVRPSNLGVQLCVAMLTKLGQRG